MDAKALITAKLAEWNLELTDTELDKLLVPYENLLRWQRVVEDMRQSRQLVEGMSMPESEPVLVHALDKKGGAS